MSRWSMRSRARRKAPLFADGSVERFTKEIRVAGMASGFLDEVEHDLTHTRWLIGVVRAVPAAPSRVPS